MQRVSDVDRFPLDTVRSPQSHFHMLLQINSKFCLQNSHNSKTVTLGKWVEDGGVKSMLVWQLSSTRFILHSLKPVNIHDLDTESSFKNSLGVKMYCIFLFIHFICLFVLEPPSTIKIILKLNAKRYFQISKFSEVPTETAHITYLTISCWQIGMSRQLASL